MNAPTMTEIKRRNAAAGFHFFEPETLRFFNSKVESGVYGRGFFVTSETPEPGTPRDYTVRLSRRSGECQTVGEFRQFDTLAAAAGAARAAAGATPEVRFEPYEDREPLAEADADPAHFHWRVYVAGLSVDVRNTRAKCEQLAAELGRDDEWWEGDRKGCPRCGSEDCGTWGDTEQQTDDDVAVYAECEDCGWQSSRPVDAALAERYGGAS